MSIYTKLIDQYLSGELNAGEKYAFEEQLENDHALRSEFEQQRSVLQGVELTGLRMEMQRGFKKGALKTKRRRQLITAASAVIGLLTVVALWPAAEEAGEKISEPATVQSPPVIEPQTIVAAPAGEEIVKPQVLKTEKHQSEPVAEKAVAPVTDSSEFYPNSTATAPGETEKIIIFGGKRSADGQIRWMGHRTVEAGFTGDSSELRRYSQRFLDSLKNSGTGFKNQKRTDSVYRVLQKSGATKLFDSDTIRK